MSRLILAAAIALLSAVALAEDEQRPSVPTQSVTFERDVRPILKARCFQCHGEGGELKGGLDARLRRLIVAGGDSGAAIEPGEPASSYLLDRVRDGEMPPGKDSRKLSATEIQTLERWIAAGAPTARPEPDDPDDVPLVTEEERAHWAFQPIRRPAPPAVREAGQVSNPIDAFLLEKLEERTLSFSPEADRRTLIRRASFDLLGLPPSPEEVEAFIKDDSADAWERLIDRLLNSPRYGERWGRHWLDVAGYADSEGYNEQDVLRADAYRYRDYVIRSFNADKPFDEFIREQMAGDEMIAYRGGTPGPEELEKLVATGFLRMAPDGTGRMDDNTPAGRNAVVTETVKIVSSALLGMTVGCAECHDHRYDPIPQRDFYRLRAIFEPALNPTKWKTPDQRRIELTTAEELAEIRRLDQAAKEVEKRLHTIFAEYRQVALNLILESEPEEDVREALRAWYKDPQRITDAQRTILEAKRGLMIPAEFKQGNVTHVRNVLKRRSVAKWQEYIDAIRAVEREARALRDRAPKPHYVRALTEPKGTPPETRVFERGNPATPGDVVTPGDLTVVSGAAGIPVKNASLPTTGRRLSFARHLTTGEHPLVSRVLVNRFWMHHFGQGLVATPGDFGTQGGLPTHPELLDWLATRFVDSGWSLKSFHRLVMSSTAYRQSSVHHHRGDAVDADNRLYWRMPLRRLEAEAVRDAILAVAGTLNLQVFGPPAPVRIDSTGEVVVVNARQVRTKSLFDDVIDVSTGPASERRRSIYVEVRRSTPPYLLEAFDAPQMVPNCESRRSTTVTQQSLLLMNSRFVVEQADAFAQRVIREAPAAPAGQVRRAWNLALNTNPDDVEIAAAERFLAEQADMLRSSASDSGAATSAEQSALAHLCQVLLNSNRFLYVD